MYRVVIADDEPKVSKLIRSLIQWDDLGLDLVGMAGDGIEALEMIGTLKPDIVITDIRMPGYDGIQLIERAKRVHPEVDFIIISGYRQFEYAQKAIRFGVEDYLVKPLKSKEINGTLKKMTGRYLERDQRSLEQVREAVRAEQTARSLREQFLEALSAERPETDPEGVPVHRWPLPALNQRFKLSLSEALYHAVFIKPDLPPDSLGVNGRRLMLDKTAAIAVNALQGACIDFFYLRRDHGILGLVQCQADGLKAVRKALQSVIDALQSQREVFPGIRVTVGLGAPSSGLGQARESLAGAQAAVDDRLLLGTGGILEGVPLEAEGLPPSLQIPTDLRRQLVNALEILDADGVRGCIGSLESRAAEARGIRGRHLLMVGGELIHVIRFGLRSHPGMEAALETSEAECREALAMCHRQRDLFRILTGFAQKNLEAITALKRQESSRPIREARRYIQEHFQSPLNLECVSHAVGFSATYFSELFKRETGMNFLEYLTDIRVKEAKRFLADPKKTIAEVAECVGYSDVKHFSKTFAKVTGIQPSQYRRLYY